MEVALAVVVEANVVTSPLLVAVVVGLDELPVKIVAGPPLIETSSLFCPALMNTGEIILDASLRRPGTAGAFGAGGAAAGTLGVLGGLAGRPFGAGSPVGVALPELLVALPEEVELAEVDADDGVADAALEPEDEAEGGSETASHSTIWPRAWRPFC